MKAIALTVLLIGFVGQTAARAAPTPEQVEFFEKRIRPVLAESCYECHNSVDKKKGDIALDYRAAVIASGVIVPGAPEESALIQAIRHAPDYEAMPSKAPKLANLIQKNFEDWIRMGAPDPRERKPTKAELAQQVNWDAVRDGRMTWWSYQPIKDHTPPDVTATEASLTPIDHFVRAALKHEDLEQQPVAPPSTLVRRLHLVLVGIPPSPEVVDAFEAAPTPQAYEAMVDTLLASKRFGERWGRYWMDWFRYAESHGSEGDPPVPYATRYRDYVIRALNADVPYDQLIREHIAGDLLQRPRINDALGMNESAIGPAHFRMAPHGFGVTDAYAEQVAFTDNQIDVISKAILGSTLSCARCHNHKFDPLSQKDFYRFYGIMISSRPGIVNIDSPALQSKHRSQLKTLKATLRQQLVRHWRTQLDAAIDALDKGSAPAEQLKNAANKADTHPMHAWFTLKDSPPERLKREWDEMRKRYEDRTTENQEHITAATYYADLRDQETYDRWFKNGTGLSDTVSRAGAFAVALQGDAALAGIYPRGVYTHLLTDKDNATLDSPWHTAKGDHTAVYGFGHNAVARFSARSYPLSHGGLHPAPAFKPEPCWIALGKYKYWNEEKVYYRFSTVADATFRANASRGGFGVTEVYAGAHRLNDIGTPAVTLPDAPQAFADRAALLRFYRDAITRTLNDWPREKLNDAQAGLLNALCRQGLFSNTLKDLPQAIQDSVVAYRRLESEIPIPKRAPGVVEGQPWAQPLLVRGDHKQEEDAVPRGFMEAFGSRTYPADTSGRLALADDVLDRNNPLTARVIVNRLWHHIFGRGLVCSNDNFGRLGQAPSHPELLDYLATRFRKADHWSMKRMVRRMVTSRTFMSASHAHPRVKTVDPSNRLLSYFTPRRLDAEAILDTLRFVSGTGTKPAVYNPVKRNALDPFLTAFNFPIPTSTVGVRDLTNVPAQNLIMLNGREARSAAARWAAHVQNDRSLTTDDARIRRLFKQAYARAPRPDELAACRNYLSGKGKSKTVDTAIAARDAAARSAADLRQARAHILGPARQRLKADATQVNDAATRPALPLALTPVAAWDFEGNSHDRVGQLHGRIEGNARIEDGALVLKGGALFTPPIRNDLKALTLDVLIQLDKPDQRGGGAMTVQTLNGTIFDSIVYAERAAREWLAGSNHHRRTLDFGGPAASQNETQPVRITIAYESDGTTHAYRNGTPYGRPTKKGLRPTYLAGQAQLVFGLRHGTAPNRGRALTGRIHDARLYDHALSADAVAAIAANQTFLYVTEAAVIAALSSAERERLTDLDEELKKAVQVLARHTRTIETSARTIPQGFARLTHALLNSKELIYVY